MLVWLWWLGCLVLTAAAPDFIVAVRPLWAALAGVALSLAGWVAIMSVTPDIEFGIVGVLALWALSSISAATAIVIRVKDHLSANSGYR